MALDIGQAWSVGPGFLRGLRRSSRRGRAICITFHVVSSRILPESTDHVISTTPLTELSPTTLDFRRLKFILNSNPSLGSTPSLGSNPSIDSIHPSDLIHDARYVLPARSFCSFLNTRLVKTNPLTAPSHPTPMACRQYLRPQ